MSNQLSEYSVFNVRCNDVMDEDGVRFCGLVNKDGNLVAGGFKRGVERLEKDKEKFRQFLVRIIEISLRKDHEDTLGKLNYVACRRNKVVLISFPFPVSDHILLVSAEPSIDIEDLAKNVCRIFSDSNLFSAWDMKK